MTADQEALLDELEDMAIDYRKQCLELEEWINNATDLDSITFFNEQLIDTEFAYNETMKEVQRIKREIEASPGDVANAASSSSSSGKALPDWSVFVSYCWSNSSEAFKKSEITTDEACGPCDPRALARKLSKHAAVSWLDVDRLKHGETLFDNLASAIKPCKFAVVCVSDEYIGSTNCKREFTFLNKQQIPYVIVVVGTNKTSAWQSSGIGLQAGDTLYIEAHGDTGTEMPEQTFQHILIAVKAAIGGDEPQY
ncbi:Leucine-rich repeat serine/threonine-protein kinase 2 [Podochytrium sp. JEL0797]|nr:Leucine-rich repeat serine/threonine-protein kinase 2 [Podochytrium sp. JEL0797]